MSNQILVIGGVTLVVFLIIFIGFSQLASRQRRKTNQKFKKKLQNISKAENYLQNGDYDQAVIEAYRHIESAIKYKLGNQARALEKPTSFELIQIAEAKRILPKETFDRIHQIRITRNKIIHDHRSTDEHVAQMAIKTARECLIAL